jgi:nascent polypeptide-associated complex subunit beta
MFAALARPQAKLNPEKLAKMAAQVRTGGKGSVRRKKKAIHKTTTTDDKRLQNTLKRLGVNNIPAIEEVRRRCKRLVAPSSTREEVPCAWHASRYLLHLIQLPPPPQVNLFKDNGMVVHFNNPKVQASIAANTYVVSGQAETKKLQDLLPGIINQLGPDSLANLKKMAETYQPGGPPVAGGDDEDVPDLVDNFETAANS